MKKRTNKDTNRDYYFQIIKHLKCSNGHQLYLRPSEDRIFRNELPAGSYTYNDCGIIFFCSVPYCNQNQNQKIISNREIEIFLEDLKNYEKKL